MVIYLWNILSIISGFDGSIAGQNVHTPDRYGELGKIQILCTWHNSFVLNASIDEYMGMVEYDDLLDYDILLTEDTIPGASLKGKHPKKLSVIELKRWLACRVHLKVERILN